MQWWLYLWWWQSTDLTLAQSSGIWLAIIQPCSQLRNFGDPPILVSHSHLARWVRNQRIIGPSSHRTWKQPLLLLASCTLIDSNVFYFLSGACCEVLCVLCERGLSSQPQDRCGESGSRIHIPAGDCSVNHRRFADAISPEDTEWFALQSSQAETPQGDCVHQISHWLVLAPWSPLNPDRRICTGHCSVDHRRFAHAINPVDTECRSMYANIQNPDLRIHTGHCSVNHRRFADAINPVESSDTAPPAAPVIIIPLILSCTSL